MRLEDEVVYPPTLRLSELCPRLEELWPLVNLMFVVFHPNLVGTLAHRFVGMGSTDDHGHKLQHGVKGDYEEWPGLFTEVVTMQQVDQ